jgi:hypothetical protein
MEEKILGKIRDVNYGLQGNCFLGVVFDFSLDGGSMGIGTSYSYNTSKVGKYAKFTEDEQCQSMIKVHKQIKEWLQDAKVEYISELKNVPVEVIIDCNTFKSFRILKEVL